MVGRLRATLVLVLLGLVLAPSTSSQTLSERLGDITFPQVLVTIGPSDVEVQLNNGAVSGQTASDLRRCIDNSSCPDSSLRLASTGNKNQQVETSETENFEDNVRFGLSAAPGLSDLRQAIRELVKIDGKAASSVRFEEFDLQNAQGPITSTETISVYIRVVLPYSGTGSGDTHGVEIQRAQADIEFAQRITVRAQDGWEIARGSIQPADMQALHSEGAIAGTQDQFESNEPLTFEIRKADSGTSAWVWWSVGGIGLLAAAGGGGYWWFRVRGKV